MCIRDLFNLVVILGTCHAGCIPQNQASSGDALNDIEEEQKNTRPNIFMDSDRITGAVSRVHEHVVQHHVDFNYGRGANGANSWYKVFPKCAGRKQSPINIAISSLKNINEKPLVWNKAYKEMPVSMSVINTAHTVVLKTVLKNDTGLPQIQGGPLAHPYTLANVHFHWSDNNHQGSEHTIDGKSFPMEMHAVHYRSDMSFENAASSAKGLAVIGYIFQIGQPCMDGLNYITERMGMLKMEQDTSVTLNNMFRLDSLVDIFTTDYVSYDGSLTTPPCHESVIWIVSPYAITISEKQLKSFRSLYSSTPNIKNNFRPVQPLNDRNITYVIAS